jgi:uncharacterized protein YjeT (DUF2065 family)
MGWVYWTVGLLWVIDGFLYFVFPRFVKHLLIKAYREARLYSAAAGPAGVGALLAWAAFSSSRPVLLGLLALLSVLQAILLFFTIRTTSPRPMERLLSLPDFAYRLWGFFFTALGPYLIAIRS